MKKKKPWRYEPAEDAIFPEKSEEDRGQHYRLLAKGVTDYALVVIDIAGHIVQWNSGAEAIFGYTRRQVLGKRAAAIFTPEDRRRNQPEREMETAAKKGRAQDKRWHLRKNGTRVWVDGVMTSLRGEDGRLRGFAKIARDDTEGKTTEKALARAHRLLERRVRERTAKLTDANKKLREEIAHRLQLEQEILSVTEREQRRIGQDLHDTLCQELAAAAFLLQSMANRQGEADAEALGEAAQIVNANVGLARDLARGLHPVELDGAGLTNALRELAFRARADVACRFESPKTVQVRDETLALNLYRIAQEALNNALKHGKPREIVIVLRRDAAELTLQVCDDGVGFPVEREHGGMGIHIMTYRANVSGGALEIESAPRGGTCVTCRIPKKPGRPRLEKKNKAHGREKKTRP